METKDIILEMRTKKGMSQEELAEKVFVTRQAVSRWETGETVPNTETLKQLSKLFDVSINTLLGSPRQLVCECCGMPIDDSNVSHEKDGAFNEDYCKWCYADGEYTLDFFEKYKELGGKEKFEEFKRQLIHEFNTLLHIEGLPKVENLNVLSGSFINLEYRLPNGQTVKFLDDNATYLGSQLECEFGGDRCFGIAANMDFLLVSTYEENGENPELVIYKKRQVNSIYRSIHIISDFIFIHYLRITQSQTNYFKTKASSSYFMDEKTNNNTTQSGGVIIYFFAPLRNNSCDCLIY